MWGFKYTGIPSYTVTCYSYPDARIHSICMNVYSRHFSICPVVEWHIGTSNKGLPKSADFRKPEEYVFLVGQGIVIYIYRYRHTLIHFSDATTYPTC